ncbi:MAG: adenylyltransferase/cytidyltransferase family protein [Acidobacteriaceae bacterium]|nr:adenylyltransferase/cytidyltransferase family protein [Acidobacteriaceae bacterium]
MSYKRLNFQHTGLRHAASAPPPHATLSLRSTVAEYFTRERLIAQRQKWKTEGKRVVFTNGCYDILHPGHIRLLERARSLGDVLILALNTDSSVQRLKGPWRPFFDEETRAELALHLEAVDAVVLFDEDTPRDLIAELLPDVLVKGADWAHFIAGREAVEAAGGQVLALPLEPGYSTTDIAEKILSNHRAELAATKADTVDVQQ